LTKEQIEHTIFPLQDLSKQEVRSLAQDKKFHIADKKDSVGICFIGDINVHKFLKDRLGENPGEVIDTSGNVIGSHQGLWFYTVGQRSGFQISAKTVIKQEDGSTIDKHNIPPFYVIKKIPEKNQLVVGFGQEALSESFIVRNMHWIDPDSQFLRSGSADDSIRKDKSIQKNLLVRIRHTGELIDCTLELQKENYLVRLKEPTKGIAEGQSAVFYKKIMLEDKEEIICLGGGVISS
jgi:tRNA-uridine 2-sulfurtransferase